jgi:hypothetical protein
VTAPEDEARAALDAAALARVLDGLDPESGADNLAREAHQRAVADVALISRAFGVLGDALAAPLPAVAGAEPAEDEASAEVIALPLWRRRPGRMMLAAAASIAVMGLGITVLVANSDNGESNDLAGSPSQSLAPAPAAPAPEAQYRTNGLSAAGSAAADSAAATQAAPAAAAPAAKSAAAAKAGSATNDDGTGESLEDAVACARGIFIGKVVSIRPASGNQVSLTWTVSDWLTPGSGPSRITYTVGDSDADGTGGKLKTGQQRLFVVPRSISASVYTFLGPDYDAAKAKIAKAQDQDKDVQC